MPNLRVAALSIEQCKVGGLGAFVKKHPAFPTASNGLDNNPLVSAITSSRVLPVDPILQSFHSRMTRARILATFGDGELQLTNSEVLITTPAPRLESEGSEKAGPTAHSTNYMPKRI